MTILNSNKDYTEMTFTEKVEHLLVMGLSKNDNDDNFSLFDSLVKSSFEGDDDRDEIIDVTYKVVELINNTTDNRDDLFNSEISDLIKIVKS